MIDIDTSKIPNTKECIVQGETLSLHPDAGMFWTKHKILFITDTHFGKVSHFRKAGLAVPLAASNDNWRRLAEMIQHFQPTELIFLGDLFHSDYNAEWESFLMFNDTFPDLKFKLVIGNHDILQDDIYLKAKIEMHVTLEIGPFIFSHHPLENPDLYNIYGHIHPSVVLKGMGKQRLKLPCFYFGNKFGIMPAFGVFTGTAVIKTKKGDQVFCIADENIHQV